MTMQFKKASKAQARLRLAMIGPSGSGKTYSALSIGQHLGKMAVIDTERGSASKYADRFSFDVLELDTFSPITYVAAIHAAEMAGYTVLIIDSLSHAWMGKDGALEQVDKAAKRTQSNNSYTAWRDVTPMHNTLIDAMLQSPCHIIVTMRSKTEYVLEENERGKKVPRKVGLAPVQRDGIEYEFDVVADLNQENDMIVSKTRCPAIHNAVINKPGQQVADTLTAWLSDGTPAPQPAPAPAPVFTPAEHAQPVQDTQPPLRYQPEQLKTRLAEIAKTMTGQISNGKRGLVATTLEAVLSHTTNPKESRHQLLAYLTGEDSLSKIPDALILAMFKWLSPAQISSGEWLPDAMASREAVAAFNHCQPEQPGLL